MTVTPAADPCVGNLATPVNSGYFIKALINNLPLYRPGISPNFRGLETGAAFGYLLYAPSPSVAPCVPPSTSKQLASWLPLVLFTSSAAVPPLQPARQATQHPPFGCDG